MSFAGVQNTEFNEEGHFALVRAIERLALMIPSAAGDTLAQSAGDDTGSSNLPPGIYSPASVEVDSNGNIVAVSTASVSSSRPSSYLHTTLVSPLITAVASAIISGTVYPFGSMTGSFTASNGFPALSFSGAGASSVITGFDTAKTYLGVITFTTGYEPVVGGLTNADLATNIGRTSATNTISSAQYSLPYAGAAGFTVRNQSTLHFVFTGSAVLYARMIAAASFSIAGNHNFWLFASTLSFVQLD